MSKKQKSHLDDLWRAAIHESGHAVVACVFDIAFRDVTIVPQEGALGACNFFAEDFYCDRKGRVIASMAGRAAEMEFFGSTAGDYRVDDESIAAVHDWPKIRGVETAKLNESSLRRRARRLVKKHHADIERVAQVLLERGTSLSAEVRSMLG